MIRRALISITLILGTLASAATTGEETSGAARYVERVNQAERLISEGRWQAATLALEEVTRLYGDNGRHWYELGRTDAAIRAFAKATTGSPMAPILR